MPSSMFDMRSFGLQELDKAMQGLQHEVQIKVMRGATRKSAARLQNEILLNASGRIVNEDTGRMVAAFEAEKPGTRKQRDGTIVAFIKLPTREALGIPRYEGDTEYYPTILEYGQPDQPPRPFMRMAVDANYNREIQRLAADLRNGVYQIWRRRQRGAHPDTAAWLRAHGLR